MEAAPRLELHLNGRRQLLQDVVPKDVHHAVQHARHAPAQERAARERLGHAQGRRQRSEQRSAHLRRPTRHSHTSHASMRWMDTRAARAVKRTSESAAVSARLWPGDRSHVSSKPLANVADRVHSLRERRHNLWLRHRPPRPAGRERHRRDRGVDLRHQRGQHRLRHARLSLRVHLILAEEQPGGLEGVEALVSRGTVRGGGVERAARCAKGWLSGCDGG